MKILLIDCSALCYASAHTLRGLEQEDIDTGVIFGFLRQLRSLSQKFGSIDFVFCWDSKSSKRKEVFPEYKIKRGKKKKEDPELAAIFAATYEQIKKLKEYVIPKIGFTNSFEQKGLEADDLMANIVLGYPNCIMVTNDEDMFQCLDDCDIWLPGKKKLITASSFQTEYGIQPHEWAEVKAIGGCGTDEVPGVPGVGAKTVCAYLNNTLPKRTKAGKSTKKYAAIVSKEGLAIAERNRPLVSLPHEDTKEIWLDDNKILSAKGFYEVCDKFGFISFTRGVDKQRWDLWLKGKL